MKKLLLFFFGAIGIVGFLCRKRFDRFMLDLLGFKASRAR